jgi:hypothetical protein
VLCSAQAQGGIQSIEYHPRIFVPSMVVIFAFVAKRESRDEPPPPPPRCTFVQSRLGRSLISYFQPFQRLRPERMTVHTSHQISLVLIVIHPTLFPRLTLACSYSGQGYLATQRSHAWYATALGPLSLLSHSPSNFVQRRLYLHVHVLDRQPRRTSKVRSCSRLCLELLYIYSVALSQLPQPLQCLPLAKQVTLVFSVWIPCLSSCACVGAGAGVSEGTSLLCDM